MLSERLKSSIKDYPDFPKKDIIFKDITPILSNPELFSDLIDKIIKYIEIRKKKTYISLMRESVNPNQTSFNDLPPDVILKIYGTKKTVIYMVNH